MISARPASSAAPPMRRAARAQRADTRSAPASSTITSSTPGVPRSARTVGLIAITSRMPGASVTSTDAGRLASSTPSSSCGVGTERLLQARADSVGGDELGALDAGQLRELDGERLCLRLVDALAEIDDHARAASAARWSSARRGAR